MVSVIHNFLYHLAVIQPVFDFAVSFSSIHSIFPISFQPSISCRWSSIVCLFSLPFDSFFVVVGPGKIVTDIISSVGCR